MQDVMVGQPEMAAVQTKGAEADVGNMAKKLNLEDC